MTGTLGTALSGPHQQVDHAEGGVVGPEGGCPVGLADDGELASVHRAVEGLGEQPGAPTPERRPWFSSAWRRYGAIPGLPCVDSGRSGEVRINGSWSTSSYA